MRARVLVIVAATLLSVPLGAAAPPAPADELLQRAIQKERVDGDLKAALKL